MSTKLRGEPEPSPTFPPPPTWLLGLLLLGVAALGWRLFFARAVD